MRFTCRMVARQSLTVIFDPTPRWWSSGGRRMVFCLTPTMYRASCTEVTVHFSLRRYSSFGPTAYDARPVFNDFVVSSGEGRTWRFVYLHTLQRTWYRGILAKDDGDSHERTRVYCNTSNPVHSQKGWNNSYTVRRYRGAWDPQAQYYVAQSEQHFNLLINQKHILQSMS